VWTISNIPSGQNRFGRAPCKAFLFAVFTRFFMVRMPFSRRIRQLENKTAVGHPVPLSKRLAEVRNQKTFRRMLALRRGVAYFCAP
jgi:hypothetical protein